MSIFRYFRRTKSSTSANTARDRLQVIVAHERSQRKQPDFLPRMQQEILDVIKKYINISQEQISVQLDDSDDCSVLELNITLPEDLAQSSAK
ncbi:MAG: cell division topological specificity factor MinE [Pseudomonadales bacterium]|nr:cell division topological specificity factor MinE [Pseudomonadales bacterium]